MLVKWSDTIILHSHYAIGFKKWEMILIPITHIRRDVLLSLKRKDPENHEQGNIPGAVQNDICSHDITILKSYRTIFVNTFYLCLCWIDFRTFRPVIFLVPIIGQVTLPWNEARYFHIPRTTFPRAHSWLIVKQHGLL